MRLIPSSLAARTVLLVVVLIAVAEMATFALFFQNRKATHFEQILRFTIGQVHLLQNVLPGLDEEARNGLETVEIGEPGFQLRPDNQFVPAHEPEFGFARRLSDELRLRLGETIELRHTGQGWRDGLWIGFMAGGERWWLILPPPRFAPQGLPRDLWWWLVSALALLLPIAGFFVRGIVRPLARLGDAVAATGAGSASTFIPEGPSEVRLLAERHNTMVGQLAKADADRREMLAGLTHDLRAPLARLRVRLALLDNDSERNGLTRDADDMERIVGQCLDFLRSEDGSQYPAVPMLVADAISDMVSRQRELGRPVIMTVGEAAGQAQVAIAPDGLRRILDNLIDNALQHGEPPVEIALDVDDGERLVLRVRDHGPGIPAERRAHALEAFAQIAPERRTGGNCGLGLAIVRRIVSGCDGQVILADASGGGLEVIVALPIVSGTDRNLV